MEYLNMLLIFSPSIHKLQYVSEFPALLLRLPLMQYALVL